MFFLSQKPKYMKTCADIFSRLIARLWLSNKHKGSISRFHPVVKVAVPLHAQQVTPARLTSVCEVELTHTHTHAYMCDHRIVSR